MAFLVSSQELEKSLLYELSVVPNETYCPFKNKSNSTIKNT